MSRLNKIKAHFLSDSAVVLTWVKSKGNWKQFVGNRVAEILSITKADQWKFVPGNINPADIVSRGLVRL